MTTHEQRRSRRRAAALRVAAVLCVGATAAGCGGQGGQGSGGAGRSSASPTATPSTAEPSGSSPTPGAELTVDSDFAGDVGVGIWPTSGGASDGNGARVVDGSYRVTTSPPGTTYLTPEPMRRRAFDRISMKVGTDGFGAGQLVYGLSCAGETGPDGRYTAEYQVVVQDDGVAVLLKQADGGALRQLNSPRRVPGWDRDDPPEVGFDCGRASDTGGVLLRVVDAQGKAVNEFVDRTAPLSPGLVSLVAQARDRSASVSLARIRLTAVLAR